MSAARTLDITGEGMYQHRTGDPACDEGWCGGDYPKPCEAEGCTGLVHADFGDEDYDGDYWLHTRCDRCGEAE
jgi:hypothetical protein